MFSTGTVGTKNIGFHRHFWSVSELAVLTSGMGGSDLKDT